MAKSEQQKQRKLAKQKTKDRQKKQKLTQQKQLMSSMAGKMLAASTGEIRDCMIGPTLFEKNPDMPMIGHVMISRNAPGGKVAVGFFLVDLGCMGVKDVHGNYRTQTEYNDVINDIRKRGALQPCEPGLARGVIEAAIAYAENCGLKPHSDYAKYASLWMGVEPVSVEDQIEFGQNGKPVYICGPTDDMARQTRIYNRMMETLGEGNFDFVMSMGGHMGIGDFELEPMDDDAAVAVVDGGIVQRIDSAE